MVFDLSDDLNLGPVRVRKVDPYSLTIRELARRQHKAPGHAHVTQTPCHRSSIDRPSDLRINANAQLLTPLCSSSPVFRHHCLHANRCGPPWKSNSNTPVSPG